jgi:hypothetical protein
MENSMAPKTCPCCGKTFQPHHKVPNQTYCSSPGCQRQRRQVWDRKKQQSDPEYRDNKNRAQRAWSDRNPGYWRKYRKANPVVIGKIQTDATQSSQTDLVPAKMDELAWLKKIPAGVYRIRPVTSGVNGSRGSWIVEITPVCRACPCQADDCQDRT